MSRVWHILVDIKTVHGVYKIEQFQALLPYLDWSSLPYITRLHVTRLRRSTSFISSSFPLSPRSAPAPARKPLALAPPPPPRFRHCPCSPTRSFAPLLALLPSPPYSPPPARIFPFFVACAAVRCVHLCVWWASAHQSPHVLLRVAGAGSGRSDGGGGLVASRSHLARTPAYGEKRFLSCAA